MKDKTDAVAHFNDALQTTNGYVSVKDLGALLDGRLFEEYLDPFVRVNGATLRQALGATSDFTTVEGLVDFLNARDPVNTFKRILTDYATQRRQGPDYYGFFTWFKYDKKSKVEAVTNLGGVLNNLPGAVLYERDLGALEQGTLGTNLRSYIEKHGDALAAELGRSPGTITNLTTLIQAFGGTVSPDPEEIEEQDSDMEFDTI